MLLPHKVDPRIVLTLDAGGTKFSFSAMAAGEEIVEPIEYPSHAADLTACLETISRGFSEIKDRVSEKPVAISFAFPGPSYYPEGIIGDLGNLPAFRGGVPLGGMLRREFSIPVFINNDGDLFTLGEAAGGLLPETNHKLEAAGSSKRFRNLIGFTIGTGFGGGIVHNGELYIGDNSAAGEVWLLRNPRYPHTNIEESVSIRAVVRGYRERAGLPHGQNLTAKDVFDIATGKTSGDKTAACESFMEMGEILGEAIANVVTVLDGLVVLGGGVSKSYELFAPGMMRALKMKIETFDKAKNFPRLESSCFNLEDADEIKQFLAGEMKEITVPGSGEKIRYDALKRCGIGRTRLGTSKAVSLGAYIFALSALR